MPRIKRSSEAENAKVENAKAEDKRKKGYQMQHVGLVLRARRREMNMSQASLAEKMQTSQEVISNYENGVTPVRADDLPRFAGILAVTPTYFFEPNYQNVVAETGCKAAGTGRRDAETGRRDAETGRRDAETGRRDAETGRRDAGTGSRALGESTDEALPPYRRLKWTTLKAEAASAAGRNDKEKSDALSDALSDASAEASAENNALAAPENTLAAPENTLAAPENTLAVSEAVPFGTPSEADLEKAMLAEYRALGSRMRRLAVKLVREIAQDEREAQSRVVVWRPD